MIIQRYRPSAVRKRTEDVRFRTGIEKNKEHKKLKNSNLKKRNNYTKHLV
ncbi:hypothetical protein RYH73_07505 [Olivibacter sp. CPCC 100613]